MSRPPRDPRESVFSFEVRFVIIELILALNFRSLRYSISTSFHFRTFWQKAAGAMLAAFVIRNNRWVGEMGGRVSTS